MWISVYFSSFSILRKDYIIDLIFDGWLLYSDINYKLLCFWIFEKLWMDNRISLNIFYWQEQDKLLIIIKRRYSISVLV